MAGCALCGEVTMAVVTLSCVMVSLLSVVVAVVVRFTRFGGGRRQLK